MPERPKLAVVCFLPDAGHVLPLLRLGRMFAEAGWQVSCYVAEEFDSIVKDYGLGFRPIRLGSRDALTRTARMLSGRSIFYNAFSNYMDLYDFYWIPLRGKVSRELAAVAHDLEAMRPECLLCDSHEFLDWYERLARCCGARLIVNRSDGTLRRSQRRFIQAYGYSGHTATLQGLVELSGRLSEWGHRLWRVLAQRARRRAAIAETAAATENARLVFAGRAASETKRTQIVSGLAVLERQLADEVAAPESPRELLLAPPIAYEPTPLSAELEAWLAGRKPAGVIYMSFGTMVVLSDSTIAELLLGLASVGTSVIWSLPASQRPVLQKHALPESFRVEQFVPQKALLASGTVRCFITHGGSNSCQEAAAFGVPVLGVPFMWDQPYNCSLLARLGMARVLPKGRVTRDRVSTEVLELLNNPRYAQSARRWASGLEALYESAPQRQLRRELVGQPALDRETTGQ